MKTKLYIIAKNNCIILKKFPGELLPGTFCDPNNIEAVQGRSELERRQQYIEVLEAAYGFLHPTLIQMVKQCLHNAACERPNTDELLTRLQRIKVDVEGEYGGSPIKFDMMRLELAKEIKMMDRRIQELTQQQVTYYTDEKIATSQLCRNCMKLN